LNSISHQEFLIITSTNHGTRKILKLTQLIAVRQLPHLERTQLMAAWP
jgi:hypothetical protein